MYHQLPEVMLTEVLNYLNPTVPTLKVGVAQEQVSSCGWSLQVGAHFHYEANYKGANFCLMLSMCTCVAVNLAQTLEESYLKLLTLVM